VTLAPVALLLAGQTLAGGPTPAAPPPPSFERRVLAGDLGRVSLRLDREVYESARPDLGDLRMVDDRGRLVPFLIDRGSGAPAPELQPAIRNQGWLAEGSASALLDFGGRRAKQRLYVRSSGGNFRRRVAVEGSSDGERWTRLVEEAWVFAVPGPQPARYETVELPENDFPLLRVTVRPGAEEHGRIRIEEAGVPAEARPLRRELTLHPRWTRVEEPRTHETWLSVDLGAAHQPFDAVVVDVSDARFFREAVVEARSDVGGRRDAAPQWVEIGRGALYRLQHEHRSRECLRLAACGRGRLLRVRLRNGDDRPLAISAVSAIAPLERVVFEAEPGRSYRLTYGSPRLSAPEFDLVRTAGDVAEWARAATEGVRGPPRPLSAAAAAPPWTEQHAGLLRGGLVLVVAALAALTYGALRRA
jgi:hypothetical protein